MEKKKEIALGNYVKDLITGYEGTLTGRAVYLNGCVRVGIQAEIDKDGKVPDGYWVDEQQIILWSKKENRKCCVKKTGGPMPAPKRQPDPRR